ncbi:MerR family transcriptional regulator [Streptomyces sp. NPDC002057]|uniref:MerR family transcriptional regulator n=1 Tax=Streptomyces sp. NPDC002057 TaxID=3154664 RepID=UPI003333E655
MSPESHGLWSIGELAERAGVTVKTVRFYSDEGLLPEAGRSGGGHRRYGPEALERLQTIRSLRTLDLPVPAVARALDAKHSLEDVIDGQLSRVKAELTGLRWREVALTLLRDAPAEERAERLRLVGAMGPMPGTDAVARFWRRWLPPRMPGRLVSDILGQAVPEVPAEPTPAKVLAFARLHALVASPCGPRDHDRGQPAAHRGPGRPEVLYAGLREAYALAAVPLRHGALPGPGDALDCFVAAYAGAGGVRDTPDFRRRLGPVLAADPRIDRYWELAGDLMGPSVVTPGAAHDWLLAALRSDAAA